MWLVVVEKRRWGGGRVRYFGGRQKNSKGGGKLGTYCHQTLFNLNKCVHRKRFFYFTRKR